MKATTPAVARLFAQRRRALRDLPQGRLEGGKFYAQERGPCCVHHRTAWDLLAHLATAEHLATVWEIPLEELLEAARRLELEGPRRQEELELLVADQERELAALRAQLQTTGRLARLAQTLNRGGFPHA